MHSVQMFIGSQGQEFVQILAGDDVVKERSGLFEMAALIGIVILLLVVVLEARSRFLLLFSLLFGLVGGAVRIMAMAGYRS